MRQAACGRVGASAAGTNNGKEPPVGPENPKSSDSQGSPEWGPRPRRLVPLVAGGGRAGLGDGRREPGGGENPLDDGSAAVSRRVRNDR